MNQFQSASATAVWYVLDLVIEPGSSEAVEYALMEAGALGTEVNDIADGLQRASGYFAEIPDRGRVRDELAEALRIYSLPTSSVRDMSLREIADQDWLGEWKKSWQPVEVGERFLIAPPWSEIPNDHNRIVIRIEPGMAFGTGTHETTRLCLVALERYFAGGSFLDVGTGTGILAIAAAKLFPDARVEGYDTDAEALAIAEDNARLNDVAGQIAFRVGTVAEPTVSADVVCANLTADVIAPLLPALLAATCGRLILSGVLDTQVDLISAALHQNGVNTALEVIQDGEWVAIVI